MYPAVAAAARAFYVGLIASGVRVYECLPRIAGIWSGRRWPQRLLEGIGWYFALFWAPLYNDFASRGEG